MDECWVDGAKLSAIWWEPDGELKVRELGPNANGHSVVSLTMREKYCGDRSEWFVEARHLDGAVRFHNMRFIGGFELG